MAAKWLPHGDPDDPEILAVAHYLEERYWRRMKVSVQNAIADAFKKK